MSYQTLSAPCQASLEIKKSTFLAFAYPITTREQAMFHVEQLRQQYPDARHHCWGYVIGDPHNTTSAGFDDDGEPNGTAGRPILSVLQHKGIGNVIIVVVRYFGGIKLGAGGLTRAYASATQLVVDAMTLETSIAECRVQIYTDFAHEAQVRYLIAELAGRIEAVDYGNADAGGANDQSDDGKPEDAKSDDDNSDKDSRDNNERDDKGDNDKPTHRVLADVTVIATLPSQHYDGLVARLGGFAVCNSCSV